MAMGNLRDGGIIIVGVSERGETWDIDGISEEHRSTYDVDTITDVAMVNETLCKILCHNLVVLIHETHELGINPVFWTESKDAA